MATSTDDDGATAPTLPQDPPSGERVLPSTKRKARGGALLGKRRKHKATVAYQDASKLRAGTSHDADLPPGPTPSDDLESGIQPRMRKLDAPRKAPTTEPSPSGPLSSGIAVRPPRLRMPSALDDDPAFAPPSDLGTDQRTSLEAPGTVDAPLADLPSIDEQSVDRPRRPEMASRPEFADPADVIGGIPSTERSPSEPGGAIDGFGDDYDDELDRETEEPDPYLGRTVAERYEIVGIIGEGGMGRVYLGNHSRLGKQVALKILHADLARDKAAVGRFVREARAASSVGNPHIVDVSDFGELPDGSTYFVMEFLDGGTLADLLDEKDVLDPGLVIDIGCQLCDGLAAAHAQDIIHRDLKPENVVLVERNDNPRFCKILDFGIAKVSAGTIDGQTKLTLAGTVFGTPHYMSPEQAAGSSVDHRADIYSLGVMLYEMAAGDLPFDADNFMGLLTQHMYKVPPPIRGRSLGEGCPPGLEAVILKCLAKRPEARYGSMEELAGDLKREAQGLRPEALDDDTQATARIAIPAEFLERARLTAEELAPPAPPPTTPWTKVAGIGLTVGLVVGGLGYTLTQRSEPTPVAQAASSTAPAPPPQSAPVASTTAVAPVTSAAAPVPGKRQVLVHSPIPGAVVYIDEEPVLLPTNIEVPEGETREVVVAAKGYHRRKAVLDGKEDRVTVVLAPVSAARTDPYENIPPAPAAPRPKTKRPSADVIVEPWE